MYKYSNCRGCDHEKVCRKRPDIDRIVGILEQSKEATHGFTVEVICTDFVEKRSDDGA